MLEAQLSSHSGLLGAAADLVNAFFFLLHCRFWRTATVENERSFSNQKHVLERWIAGSFSRNPGVPFIDLINKEDYL